MHAHLVWTVRCLATAVLLASSAIASDRQTDYIQLRKLVGEERFSEAFDRCRNLIARYPDYVYLYETLPEIALYAQDLESAAKFFEDRIEDGTRLELSYFGLGTVYYNMSAYREAALCFDRAIELGIAAPECYRNFVYAYERLEGVDASIRFFNSLCHRDPKNPHLWYAAALAYWSKRDYPVVLRNINEGLTRRPDERKYLQAKAAVLLLMGKKKEGATLTSHLISLANQECDLAGIQFLSSYEVLRQDRETTPKLENELARQSLQRAMRFGQFRWIGWWYERLANIEYWKSLFGSAMKHSQMAFDASRKCSDNQLALDALVRQVESSMDLGCYDNAIEYAYKELEISREEKDNGRMARSLSDLAWIYHELGVEDVAIEYAIEALATSENTKSTNEFLIKIHTTLGLIYEAMGNNECALANLTAADQLMPKGGLWNPNQAISHGNIGRVFMKLGDLRKATYHFTREHTLSRSSSFSREEAYSLVNLADLQVHANRLTSAKRFYVQAYKLSKAIAQRPTQLSAAIGMARLAVTSGCPLDAIAWYDTAFSVAESMGLIWERRLLGEIRRNPYDNDIKNYINALVLLGKDAQAFSFAERYRFSSSITDFRVPQKLRVSRDPSGSKRQGVITETDTRSEPLCIVKSLGDSPLTKGPKYDLDALAKNVLGHLQNRNLLQTAAHGSSDAYWGSLRRVASLSEVQHSLRRPSSAVIEYLVGDERCLAFLITADTIRVVRLQIGLDELEKLLDRIANVFSSKSYAGHSWSPNLANFDVNACAEAYQRLLKPVVELLPAVDELTIIPDGILAGIPFECFVTDHGSTGVFSKVRFVLNKLALNYSSSASSITFRSPQEGSPNKVLLAIGNPEMNNLTSELGKVDTLPPALARTVRGLPPLPGAEKEVSAIAQEFQGNATVLLGRDATKANLKALISNYRIVHIAAHTSIDQNSPMLSAIYFAPDNEEKRANLLFASELINCGINARLVVLSSCNTFRFSRGSDEAGFTHALTEAGVPSIVGCLWSADDNSTAVLMSSFYHHLSAGDGIAKALQKAKIELIHSGKADPFYWAPFILIGDPSPFEAAPTSGAQATSWAFGGGLATLVLISLLVYRVRVTISRGVRQRAVLTSAKGRRDY